MHAFAHWNYRVIARGDGDALASAMIGCRTIRVILTERVAATCGHLLPVHPDGEQRTPTAFELATCFPRLVVSAAVRKLVLTNRDAELVVLEAGDFPDSQPARASGYGADATNDACRAPRRRPAFHEEMMRA